MKNVLKVLAKRLPTPLLALALFGLSHGANASGYQCSPISGTVTIAVDPYCKIVNLPFIQRRFPSVTFLGSLGVLDTPTCFTGDFSGELADIKITGKSVSGLTSISSDLPPDFFSPSFATAATVLAVSKDGKLLGNLYLLDTIHFIDDQGNAEEQLVITEGTRAFLGAKGNLGIAGNEFAGALAKGTLCLPE
jgi:hypothetical protein